MTVYRNCVNSDSSTVELDEARILPYDKMNRCYAPRRLWIGVFHRRVSQELPAGEEKDPATVCQELLATGKLASYEVHWRFCEIGSPNDPRETAEYPAGKWFQASI